MAEERLQKILARAGVASRRAAEKLMREGRVVVNGQVASQLGTKADAERDYIRVDGVRIKPTRLRAGGARHYYVAFKPREMITSLSDPEGRPTVADLLRSRGVRARVYPVGRLDWDADGLLLLTDDGELANRVMHPREHLPKVYRVKVRGVPDDRALDRVRRGVTIEPGVRTLPAEVSLETTGDNASWLRVVLVEGRQHQIKKMFERVGHPVRRIRRMAVGPLRLGRLKVGDVRPLTEVELLALRRAVGLES
ncbi:MAG: rRNA pseudouridine synthase [Acidobacteria bacterium]|nr:rRNA pseudouridine synthase [Acidobacteriota bacterium]